VAAVIYLDTHVAIWLYALGADSLSSAAAEVITAEDDIRVSPMARLELQYLYEIERVTEPAAAVLDALHAALGLTVCTAPFAAVVREAERHAWTRDPFDRLIVAQASLHEAPLVTKDETLHAQYAGAVW
jgi:PIN domain nuclease of toxin-antitoxin system